MDKEIEQFKADLLQSVDEMKSDNRAQMTTTAEAHKPLEKSKPREQQIER